jgi:FMN phosphatase YigB (HAD superfamily)
MPSEKKYIILDLDNTIYPVHDIGDELFKPLFELLELHPGSGFRRITDYRQLDR